MKSSNRVIPLVLIVSIAGVLLYCTLTSGQDWGDDFAAYIMQAQSLGASGPRSFIEENRFTVDQSSVALGPVAYPWGYPVLLAPLYSVGGLDPLVLKSAGALSYLLFLLVLWAGFRSVHAPSWLLVLVSLFALNPGLLAFANNILSDLPFLLASTLSLVLIGAFVIQGRVLFSRVWDAVLLGVVIAAAFSIRTNGVLLLLSLGVAQLVADLGRQALARPRIVKDKQSLASWHSITPFGSAVGNSRFMFVIPYAVFCGLVVPWMAILPDGGAGYMSRVQGISVATIANLYYYVTLPSEFFAAVPFYGWLYLASIPFAVAGVIQRRRSDCHTLIYVALTFALYAAWPDRQGLRFLFPVLPFYVSFVISGLEMIQGGRTIREQRLRQLACFAPVVFSIACFGRQSVRNANANISRNREASFGPFTASAKRMFSFVSENTAANSTVIFFKPRAMRLMTNRRSIMINKAEDLSRGDYLCFDLGKSAYDQVSLADVTSLLREGTAQLVFEDSGFKVYRLRKRSTT